MNKPLLQVQKLRVVREKTPLIDNVSFDVAPGECVALLGSNGAGKSSLMRALTGYYSSAGEIKLEGRHLSALSPLHRAELVAYLPQRRPLAWSLSVEDVVQLGYLKSKTQEGSELLDLVLCQCDLSHLRHRDSRQLSGGELSRVHLARALITQSSVLLADEPIAELDPLHQYSVLHILREYASQTAQRSVVVALHNITLAARFAHRVIVLHHGQILADGPPLDVITPNLLAKAYNINAYLADVDGLPNLVVKDTFLPSN